MKKLLKQLLNVKTLRIISAKIEHDSKNEPYVVIQVEQIYAAGSQSSMTESISRKDGVPWILELYGSTLKVQLPE